MFIVEWQAHEGCSQWVEICTFVNHGHAQYCRESCEAGGLSTGVYRVRECEES